MLISTSNFTFYTIERILIILLVANVWHARAKPIKVDVESQTNLTSGYNIETDDNRVLICQHKDCLKAATEIIQSMDENYQPCEDFVQFSCGGWVKENPVPHGFLLWHQFGRLATQLKVRIISILKHTNEISDEKSLVYARNFYTSCVNETKMNLRGLEPLFNELSKSGGWPMIKTTWRKEDFKVTSEAILNLYLDEIEDSPADIMKYSISYKNYIKRIAIILSNKNINDQQINSDIEDLFNLETKIVTINNMKNVNYLVSYINILKLINETDTRVKANLYQWNFVKLMGRETTNAMRNAALEFMEVVTENKPKQSRNDKCFFKTIGSFGMAIGKKYVEKLFSASSKNDVNLLVDNIKSSFIDIISHNQWIDEETKAYIYDKTNKITKNVGYPDWYNTSDGLQEFYKNLGPLVEGKHFENILELRSFRNECSNPSNNWLTTPIKAAVFYNGLYNDIEIPAAILQPPFYGYNLPHYLNYGGIGTVIGHEISHGFDSEKILVGKNIMHVTRKQEKTIEKFKENVQCIIDQYEAYRIPALGTDVRNASINGILTQGENFSDNSGLLTAFLAYKSLVKELGEEPALPGLTKYTQDQLFFISNAQTMCASTTKEGLLKQILVDSHSPQNFRIIGSMSNMEEFSQVWNCPVGSPMNPEKKCRVW